MDGEEKYMLERRRRNRPEGEGSRTAHRLLLTGAVVAALVGGGALAVHAFSYGYRFCRIP